MSNIISFFLTVPGATLILALITVLATVSNIYYNLKIYSRELRNKHHEMLKDKCLAILHNNLLQNNLFYPPITIDFEPLSFYDTKGKKWWKTFRAYKAFKETAESHSVKVELIPPTLYFDLQMHFKVLYGHLTVFEKAITTDLGNLFRFFEKITHDLYEMVDLNLAYTPSSKKFKTLLNQQGEVSDSKKLLFIQLVLLKFAYKDTEPFWQLVEDEFSGIEEDLKSDVNEIVASYEIDFENQLRIIAYRKLIDIYISCQALILESLYQVYLNGDCEFVRPKGSLFNRKR